MTEAIWLAVVSALLTLVGVLGAMAYKDIARRIVKLEKQDTKLSAAILTLLISKSDDHDAIARALHSLMIDGIERVPGD